MKHSERRRDQWRNYYERNSAQIRDNVEEKRAYLRSANKRLLAQTGVKQGCSECKGKFIQTSEVKWYYNASCPYFGSLLSQKLHTLDFFDKFAPRWGRFFCCHCYNEFINLKGHTKRRAYELVDSK